jgi:hypothetical protein
MPGANIADTNIPYGYAAAQTMVQVLKQCNGDFSSENILKQATNLKDFVPDLIQNGLSMSTSPTDFFPFHKLELARFDGKSWVPTGDAPKVD